MSENNLQNVGKRLGDLSDLPDELRGQLQAEKLGILDEQIISVIKSEYGEVANIDEILVGLYRKYNTVHMRIKISNKLNRMTRAKLLHSVKSKKGVYSTNEIT